MTAARDSRLSERQQIEQRIAALSAQKWPDRRDAILDAAIDAEVLALRARLLAVERIERAIRSVTVQKRYSPNSSDNKVLDDHLAQLRARLEQHPDEDVNRASCPSLSQGDRHVSSR